MSIVPESLFFGVAIALVFDIVVGSSRLRDWALKLVHKKRKKVKHVYD